MFEKNKIDEECIRRYWTPVLDVAFALLIGNLWYATKHCRISKTLAWPPLAYIGRISYGMYLYHMLAHVLTWQILLVGIEGWNRYPKFAMRLAVFNLLTVGIASLSYFTLERTFLALKSKL